MNAQPTAETVAANQNANHTTPTPAWLSDLYAIPLQGTPTEAADIAPVTGNFTGSTDMILRWAACKWGVDEDVARAQAYEESSWVQSLAADSDTVCHSRNVPTTALNYWSEASPCNPSKGILQIKLIFFNAFPYAETSTGEPIHQALPTAHSTDAWANGSRVAGAIAELSATCSS